jgi:hypothetical protein
MLGFFTACVSRFFNFRRRTILGTHLFD